MRIVMNPDAEASGGGGAVVDKPVETKAEVKPVVEAKVEPKGRFVPDDQWAEFERLKAESAERAELARRAEEDKLREKGKWEEIVKKRDDALTEAQKRADELEARTKKSVLTRDLATALSGQPLVKGAANQLLKLWADEFEVNADGDEWKVSTRDRKSPDQFVREMLSSDEFSHFVKAEARGGAGGGGDRPDPSKADPSKPPSYLDQIAANLEAQRQHQNGRGLATRR